MRTLVTLAALWWFCLGGLGAYFPFITLYLSENLGLSGAELGLVVASPPLIGLLVQPFWGQVADRSGKRGRVVALLAAGAAVGYALLYGAQSFPAVLLCTVLLSAFFTALIPSTMALSLALLPDRDRRDFGRVRTLGTLGFGASVLLLPPLLHLYQREATITRTLATEQAQPHLEMIFLVAMAMMLITAACALKLPEAASTSERAARGEWRALGRNGRFLRALAFGFIFYLSSQGAMVLFPMLVRAQGGGLDAISQMWALMLSLEIPLVYYFGRAVERIGPRGVVFIGCAAGSIRWLVSGFAEDLDWVYAAQLLHGVTVWGVILGLPVYIDAVVPGRLRSTGQGMLAMVGISLGSILSNFASGWLTEVLGPKSPAQIAGVAGLGLALVMPWLLPRLPAHPIEDIPPEDEVEHARG